MKAFIIFALLAFLGGSQAGLLDDLSAAATSALDGILTTAQTAAQDLLDTYVPVLGQAAQQLVGDAVSNLGQSLTNLFGGKKKRQELQTEIGSILHEGVLGMLEHVTTAIQNVQTALSAGVQALFGSDSTTQTDQIATTVKGHLVKNRMKARSAIAKTGSKMSRGFFSDLGSAVSVIFQPAIDQAAAAFNTLVDAATAVGSQVVAHGQNFLDNVTNTVNGVVAQVGPLVTDYVSDAQTIIASITDHVQETFQTGTTA